MPRTKITINDVAEAGPGLWSNCIRAGDFLFISGQVARPLEGGKTLVGSTEYEQAKQIFMRIKRICEGAGALASGAGLWSLRRAVYAPAMSGRVEKVAHQGAGAHRKNKPVQRRGFGAAALREEE